MQLHRAGKKVVACLSAVSMLLTSATFALPRVFAEDPAPAVPFEEGVFTDSLDSTANMAWYSENMEGINGSTAGKANASAVYYAGEGESFTSLTVKTVINTWYFASMDYGEAPGESEVRAYVVAPNAEGGYDEQEEIPVVRMADTALLSSESSRMYCNFTNASPLPEGTQYIRIDFFKSGNFRDGKADVSYAEDVVLTNTQAERSLYYTQDRLNDTSVAWSIGKNLEIDSSIKDPELDWYTDTFYQVMDRRGLGKIDEASSEGNDLVYYNGAGIQNIIVQIAETKAIADSPLQIWTSANGESYEQFDGAEWFPLKAGEKTKGIAVLQADNLPENTKYVKIIQDVTSQPIYITHVVYATAGLDDSGETPLNYQGLKEAIDSFDALVKEDYTEESWTASNIEALVAAGRALMDNASEQSEINDAAAAIKNAISALLRKPGVVSFDDNGVFLDELDHTRHMAWFTENLANISGDTNAIADAAVVYDAGEGKSFSSFTVKAHYNPSNLYFMDSNETPGNSEIRAYAVTPDGKGGFVEGEEIPVVRLIDSEKVSSQSGVVYANYTNAAPLPAGTQYVKIYLFKRGTFWWADGGLKDKAIADAIELTSSTTTQTVYRYTEDRLNDDSLLYSAGSNLELTKFPQRYEENGYSYYDQWNDRTRYLMDHWGYAKIDPLTADNTDLVYYSEDGFINNIAVQMAVWEQYAESPVDIWTSADGSEYTRLENTEWIPLKSDKIRVAVLFAEGLPRGTKYVKISQDITDDPVYITHVVYGALDPFGELSEAVAAYNALDPEDYYPDSWTASGIEAAVAAAKVLLSNPDSDMEEVKAAAAAIYEAIGKLQALPPPDTADLEAKLNEFYALDRYDYTAESWEASDIEAVIAAAEAVLKNPESKQADLDEQVEKIDAALARLQPNAQLEPVEPTGESVAFANGLFEDTLGNTSHIAEQSAGLNNSNGSLSGTGYIVYDVSETFLKGLKLDVSHNNWNMDFSPEKQFKAYVALPNGQGSFTRGQEIQLTRQLTPEIMTPNGSGQAMDGKSTYISGTVPANVQFVWIELTQSAILLDTVKLYSTDSAEPFDRFLVDNCVDFSLVENEEELTNLKVKDDFNVAADQKWIQSYGTYLERDDATTTAGATMTYKAPAGKQWNSMYVQAFYMFSHSPGLTVWASSDGVDYFQVKAPEVTVAGAASNNWVPYIVNTTLPSGAQYVQLRFPEFSSSSLYGMKHPRITSIQMSYGTKGAWIDPVAGSVAFEDGVFSDHFNNLDNTIKASDTLSASPYNLKGPGHLIYKLSSDDQLKGLTVDATYEIWGLNFDPEEDLKAYVATTEDERTFEKGAELKLVRKLRPQDMSAKNWMEATYEFSGDSVPSNARYIWIELPTSGFGDVSNKFQVKEIRLYNTSSSKTFYNYTQDSCDDLTANLNSMENIELFHSAQQWFSNANPVYAVADYGQPAVLTYRAASGSLKNLYAQLHLNSNEPLEGLEVWAAASDRVYSRVSGAVIQSSSFDEWSPWTVSADLPADTEFVQIRIPAYGHDITISSVAIDGVLTNVPPEEKKYTVNFAEHEVAFDGVFEEDEWSDAAAMTIEGTQAGGNRYGATLYFKYDYENLYLAMVVDDPTPMVNNNTGANIWNGDNLELFYGTENLDGEDPTMLPSDIQVVLSGSLTNGTQSYLNIDGSYLYPTLEDMMIQKHADGKGYTMEVALPLETLRLEAPWEGTQMILNAVLNENSSSGRGQWGWTTTGEANKKKRNLWGEFNFAVAPAPQAQLSVTASVDTNTNRVTVNGQLVDAAERMVTLKALDAEGKVAYLRQIMSLADGSFSTSFIVTPSRYADGIYTLTAGGEEIDRKATAEFSLNPDVVSFTALNNALAAYDALKKADYTEESWTASNIEAVVAAGRALLANPDAMQEQVNEAAQAIQTAIAALKKTEAPTVDVTALNNALAAYDALEKADYTEESWTASNIEAVAAAGRALLTNPDATQEQVNEAAQAIQTAIAALKKTEAPTVDVTALNNALAAYDALKKADYTEESWTASNIEAVAAAGRALLTNPDATQEQVNEAAQAIQTAIAALKKTEAPTVDVTALNNALAAYDALKKADYTEESWTASNIEAVAAAGRALLTNPDATQEQVNEAAQAIQTAIAALVEAKEPTVPTKPQRPYHPATHYVIVATAGEGGSISPAGAVYVEKGGDLTFTITPDAGYQVKQVLIDRKEAVSLVNGTYTFQNVNEPYTIDVTFEPAGVGIEVTNPETPQTPEATPNPQTGDSIAMTPAWLGLLMGGMAVCLLSRKRRQG